MFSELTDNTILSPCFGERDGEKITKITIHHAAGILSGENLARIFSVPRRSASCNYVIGKNGEIVGVVPEEKRSFCSGSRWNDSRAITIEVSNSSGKPNWEVSDAVIDSLVKLCADICRRYCIVPYFNGTKDASFTLHNMFQATECPGPYLKKNLPIIIDMINNELCIKEEKPKTPMNEKQDFSSYKVKVTANCLNIRKEATSKSKKVGEITDKGVYTIVEEKDGFGKLKSGAGWISLKYVKKV